MKKIERPNSFSNDYVPVRVRVTRNDIRNGIQASASSCPIAQSLSRVCTRKVRVIGERLEVGNLKFRAPKWVNKFVEVFDELYEQNNMTPRRRTVYLPTKFLKRFNEVR